MLASFLSQTQGKKRCSQQLFWWHLGLVLEVTSTNRLKPVCLCSTNYSISVVPGARKHLSMAQQFSQNTEGAKNARVRQNF